MSTLLQLFTCSETARADNDGCDDYAEPPTPSSSSSHDADVEHKPYDASSSDSRRRGCDNAGGWDAAIFAVCAFPADDNHNHKEEEDAAAPAPS
jgi:hypothetical protein